MIRYALTAGDGLGWAIDEDARLIRSALHGVAVQTSAVAADVVHSPFWVGLNALSPKLLHKKFVVAHADNPPFFYLTQPDFAWAQEVVDLWVARSAEARQQFGALGLRCVHIPYAIDGALFHPVTDRHALRRRLGLPDDAYVIGNFHRDTEGADLKSPKVQKAPELLVRICVKARAEGIPVHVLLAGPRRHWIRAALTREGVPFTYVGDASVAGDDVHRNILPRDQLNELYSACDLYVIPSRWEGGPQSAMEAAAARTKVLSIPLGVGRDILEPRSLFDCADEAVHAIRADFHEGWLTETVEKQHQRWKASHELESMARSLRELYAELERELGGAGNRIGLLGASQNWLWRILRRAWPPRTPRSVRLVHEAGHDPYLDSAVDGLRTALQTLGISTSASEGHLTVAGKVSPQSLAHADIQLWGPHSEVCDAIHGAWLLATSVQDAVNFRAAGGCAPVIVCPLTFHANESPQSDPLVIPPNDLQASNTIRQALLSRRPVIYPHDSAYYYGVFHAGLAYGEQRTLDEAKALVSASPKDFTDLAVTGTPQATTSFLRQLLQAR